MPNLNNQTTINIKTFGNNDAGYDRISLEKRVVKTVFNKTYIYVSYYQVEGNTIKREVLCSINFAPCPGVQKFTEFVVEGRRKGEVTEEALRAEKPNIFQFR